MRLARRVEMAFETPSRGWWLVPSNSTSHQQLPELAGVVALARQSIGEADHGDRLLPIRRSVACATLEHLRNAWGRIPRIVVYTHSVDCNECLLLEKGMKHYETPWCPIS